MSASCCILRLPVQATLASATPRACVASWQCAATCPQHLRPLTTLAVAVAGVWLEASASALETEPASASWRPHVTASSRAWCLVPNPPGSCHHRENRRNVHHCPRRHCPSPSRPDPLLQRRHSQWRRHRDNRRPLLTHCHSHWKHMNRRCRRRHQQSRLAGHQSVFGTHRRSGHLGHALLPCCAYDPPRHWSWQPQLVHRCPHHWRSRCRGNASSRRGGRQPRRRSHPKIHACPCAVRTWVPYVCAAPTECCCLTCGQYRLSRHRIHVGTWPSGARWPAHARCCPMLTHHRRRQRQHGRRWTAACASAPVLLVHTLSNSTHRTCSSMQPVTGACWNAAGSAARTRAHAQRLQNFGFFAPLQPRARHLLPRLWGWG